MRNIRLLIEFDGTGLFGWQRQADRPTVQGHLESALARLTGEKISVIGAGRTDAGVHARGQTANFKTDSRLTESDILRGGNALLPPQIAILTAEQVPLDFHARYDARSKVYDYYLYLSPIRPALRRRFVWHLQPGLDLETMGAALARLVGRHDFASFQSTGSGVKNTVRNVLEASISSRPEGLVRISIEADGFLRQMVRAVVGTLVDVGRGRTGPAGFEEIMRAKDRSRAGPTAPAHGLCLREVRY